MRTTHQSGHRNCVIVPLISLIGGLALGHPASPGSRGTGPISATTQASWRPTGSLNTARYAHTSTVLANGKILVAGGASSNAHRIPPLTSAELYDPAAATWTTTGSLNKPRSYHTATLLPNGKVLVVGGDWETCCISTSELYDPATGSWSLAGTLQSGRIGHTVTLLPNGKALLVGGRKDGPLKSAELYDPVNATWSVTGSLNTKRADFASTLLDNGMVLVSGGFLFESIPNVAELYNPATGAWSIAARPNSVRVENTATLLTSGKVLVAGGYKGITDNDEAIFDISTELYDPATDRWSITGDLVTAPTYGATLATLLPGGQIFSISGSALQLYDPEAGTWRLAAGTSEARQGPSAVLMPNGKVIVTGGWGDAQATVLRSAEIYDPGLTPPGAVASASAASYHVNALTAETIATSFGSGLATSSVVAGIHPLPTELGGTAVKVRDSAGTERLAPLFFVSPRQINYQIPAGTAVGVASVTITNGSVAATGTLPIRPVAPGLFSANQSGQGVAAAVALRVRADGSQNLEAVAEFDALQNRFVLHPIDLGPESDRVFLILFGTGIRFRSSLLAVIAAVGGEFVEVTFAGALPDFAGLDQVNLMLPRSLRGRGEMEVSLAVDAQIANAVRVSIK